MAMNLPSGEIAEYPAAPVLVTCVIAYCSNGGRDPCDHQW
jgi:hypothetical protein